MNEARQTTLGDIVAARRRIGKALRPTPIVHAYNLSQRTGVDLYLKLESSHITGSFKERGALNCLTTLTESQRAAGVVAASAGNHAQGLSLHASRLGVKATILMPEHTPIVKVTRTRGYGGDVQLVGATFDDSNARAKEICMETGATYVSAFNHPAVIAGQGTCALEILERDEDFDALIVPVGGGGLLAGMSTAFKEMGATTEIIGVQTEAFPAMARSFEAGHVVEAPIQRTIADGIAVRAPGTNTFALIRQNVDSIITVSEEDITRAILALIENERVIAEGAGATPVAALLAGKLPHLKGKRVCLVISGGNIDTNVISDIIQRGLVRSGRRVELEVAVPDRPGTLAQLTRVIAEEQANVLEIRHDRAFSEVSLGETDISLWLETRSIDAIHSLCERLESEGFRVRRNSMHHDSHSH